MEKCGFNILLLLPVTGASGAGSHTAISPTQHKAHSRQDRLLTMYPDHLSWCGLLSYLTAWLWLPVSCPVVTSVVGVTQTKKQVTTQPTPAHRQPAIQ